MMLRTVKASDGQAIYLHTWLPEKDMRAVIVLLHGMAEHSKRYEEFARYLNVSGIGMYAHDQRGHGLTGQAAGELGHLPPNWGWHLMIDDACRLIRLAQKESACPIYLLGHSMGSFLARVLVQQNPQLVDGLILSGTGNNPAAMVQVGRKLAAWMCRYQGEKNDSKLLHALTFGWFNQKIKGHKTAYDWLCRSKATIQSYMDDSFCQIQCTNGFYYELYDLNLTANQLEKDRRLPKSLPILIFSGTDDPVGDMGDGVRRVYSNYYKCGLQDVRCHLYPGGRHEMLNEINKTEVYADVRKWLLEHLQK